MRTIGKFVSASRELVGRNINLTLSIPPENAEELNNLQGIDLDIEVKKYRKKRSLDANAMLWACLGEIARETGRSAWDEYLSALKKYGKFTYIVVKPNVVDAMKAQWRECEVVGDIDVNGSKAVQMLCYFGSSTYDSKEFSVLLNGVVEDMKDLGLQPPPSREMRKALEKLEQKEDSNDKDRN
jgi:hypothetical protein